MTRYLRLVGVQLRTSLAQAMAYRANFLVQGMTSVAWLALSLLPLFVLFDQRQQVAGWSRADALIVMGYFMGVKAVLEGVVSPSLVDLVERIRTGAFDYALLKPIDSQVLVSTAHYEPWKVFDLLGALAVVVYAFTQKAQPPAPADAAIGALLFVAGVLAMYSLWIICAAASFWVVRLDNLIYLLGAIFDTARFPVQIFQGVWRVLFTFVIPVAIMTTFPAMALLGQLATRTVIATLAGAVAMLLVSRVIWRSAIRNYTSASS